MEPLFAWSWDGHGQLTALAVAAAVSKVVAGTMKPDLMKRLRRLHLECVRAITGGRTEELYKGVGDDPVPSRAEMENALGVLLHNLPLRVQEADLHSGNIPWGVGEWLDANGQVRHFMRSTPGLSDREAHAKSVGWIRDRLTAARAEMRDALYRDRKFAFYDIVSSGNAGDLAAGVTALAEGLHTVEDSYAPGHVLRDPGAHNLIQAIHYWDDANKKASGDWPGHEALDNPTTAQSKPFFKSATETTTDFIVCVLTTLDGDQDAFATGVTKLLDSRFHLQLSAASQGKVSPNLLK